MNAWNTGVLLSERYKKKMELRNEKESFIEGLQKWMDKLPFKKKKKSIRNKQRTPVTGKDWLGKEHLGAHNSSFDTPCREN